MRLISAHIVGYGRLRDVSVNLDAKVIAVVGPNEAGKTTLLRALQFIDDDEELAPGSRTRGSNVQDHDVVSRVTFILDDEDKDAVSHFRLRSVPERLELHRQADGSKIRVGIIPSPLKEVETVQDIIESVTTTVTEKFVEENLEELAEEEVNESLRDSALSHFGMLEIIKPLRLVASGEVTVISDELRESVTDFLEEFAGVDDRAEMVAALQQLLAWMDFPEPAQEIRDILWRRSPTFLYFDVEDRTLQSSYALTENLANDPPAALKNLTKLAGLSLPDLWSALAQERDGDIRTLINRANRTLATAFRSAWKQSDLAIAFDRNGTTLSIMIEEDGDRVTVFDERSAGLRMFAALFAFMAAAGQTVQPIVMIDEAETHLHFDAQADLVNMFLQQDQAAKIIYTTHSPGCLPPDLGTGIRAVLPTKDDPDISKIHNSFWQKSAGFSPLMLAMGAGASSFSPGKRVVLAEGASEMLLLPSLLRSATGKSNLGYHVAPGLSEAPTRLYPDLDLEAAKVAYVVDGDDGGKKLAKSLKESGVPEDRIVTLQAITLENVLDAEIYRTVFQKILGECNVGKEIEELPSLTGVIVPWPKFFEDWAAAHGLSKPSKIAVANRLNEERLAIPSVEGKASLIALHQALCSILHL